MRAKKAVAENEFVGIKTKTPATLASVVDAVMRLSTLSEAEILDLVSADRLGEVFPFRPGGELQPPEDFVAEADLIEASPKPLKRRARHELIHASVAVQAKEPRRGGTSAAARTPTKSARSRSINTRLRSSPQR
jgi:hypothetical protein